MAGNNRVVKFRRRRSINIGVIVFLILFVYIAIYVYIYFTKEHMSIYEVQEGFNVEDYRFTGLILRNEEVVGAARAGYIAYFQKEGDRVSKNTPIYSVDESRDILDYITSSDEPFTFSKENRARFMYKISSFHETYSDYDFESVYRFKEEALSTAMDLINQAMIEKGRQVKDETGFNFDYEVISSDKSGIVSYYMDSYEGIEPDTVTSDMFDPEAYEKVSLRTNEMVSPQEPVYKLISSENWSIMLKLDEQQYKNLLDKETISFTVLRDDFETEAKLKLSNRGNAYYAELQMDKYMFRYLQDRFLDIILHVDSARGLKIPLTAIVEKEFYLVPADMFTEGANSSKKGLVKQTYEENGDIKLTFIPTDIYKQDEVYAYVDTLLFDEGTLIKWPEKEETYTLQRKAKLTGVYNVNKGYAVFRRIEILFQNEAYCIIKEGTSYGLSAYDHITLDAKTAVEQQIIY